MGAIPRKIGVDSAATTPRHCSGLESDVMVSTGARSVFTRITSKLQRLRLRCHVSYNVYEYFVMSVYKQLSFTSKNVQLSQGPILNVYDFVINRKIYVRAARRLRAAVPRV